MREFSWLLNNSSIRYQSILDNCDNPALDEVSICLSCCFLHIVTVDDLQHKKSSQKVKYIYLLPLSTSKFTSGQQYELLLNQQYFYCKECSYLLWSSKIQGTISKACYCWSSSLTENFQVFLSNDIDMESNSRKSCILLGQELNSVIS